MFSNQLTLTDLLRYVSNFLPRDATQNAVLL